MRENTRPPIIRARFEGELVVDNFAGGGGASTGIEAAVGRPVDIAINHSPEAIAMHRANHPETRHFCENIWEVDPKVACGGRAVGLAWFSPDCTHFSRAKGTKPLKQEIRGLAWVVVRWAKAVRPRVIVLENVEEFQTWGPLDETGRPRAVDVGRTFREWLGALKDLGYEVEFKTLIAADYGTPTTRKRLFLVARRDRGPIAWPEPTHGKGRRESWRPAADVIDWALPCPSIFDRARPLAEATLHRIAVGIQRYVLDASQPFILPVKTWGGGGNDPRSIELPMRTVTASKRGEFALCAPSLMHVTHQGGDRVAPDSRRALAAAFLTKFYGTAVGADARAPMPTVTGQGGHLAEVRAFLIRYYGAGGRCQTSMLDEPLGTVTTRDRFGLVRINSEDYEIADIGMRMLQPHELFAAQGFPEDYEIAPLFNGKPLTKTAQVKLAGNAVNPQIAEAIVASNARAA